MTPTCARPSRYCRTELARMREQLGGDADEAISHRGLRSEPEGDARVHQGRAVNQHSDRTGNSICARIPPHGGAARIPIPLCPSVTNSTAQPRRGRAERIESPRKRLPNVIDKCAHAQTVWKRTKCGGIRLSGPPWRFAQEWWDKRCIGCDATLEIRQIGGEEPALGPLPIDALPPAPIP